MAYARVGVKMRAKAWAEVAILLTDRDRLEKNVVDQTLRVHRFRGTLDITKNHINAFVSILEEGKVKVKTATREKEAATAKVRRQETERAAAKAVLEER